MTDPLGLLTIDFAGDGNASEYLGEGWSWKEPIGIWTLGGFSTLKLPAASNEGPHRFIFELVPFVSSPAPDRQRLTVLLNGTEVQYAELTDPLAPTRLEFTAPPGLVNTAGVNEVTILHPDYRSQIPENANPAQRRTIALRFLRLRVVDPTARRAVPAEVVRSVAILTTARDDKVNLPIWLRYYSTAVPEANLFVIDPCGDDGPNVHLPRANRIPLPPGRHDVARHTRFVNALQHAFMRCYDVVIYVECDELLVPDPDVFSNLSDYVQRFHGDTVSAVGLQLRHALSLEGPIDLTRSILSQRRFCQFSAACCKPSIISAPVIWQPGFEACDREPIIDPGLFLFDLETMDLDLSRSRQARAAGAEPAPDADFIAERFHVPSRRIDADGGAAFEFVADIARLRAATTREGNFWKTPPFLGTIAHIPDAFVGIF